jgi:hypothetical protein
LLCLFRILPAPAPPRQPPQQKAILAGQAFLGTDCLPYPPKTIFIFNKYMKWVCPRQRAGAGQQDSLPSVLALPAKDKVYFSVIRRSGNPEVLNQLE